MNGNAKPTGRSRPTNNQLLYKAHFRWQHYTSPLSPSIDLPDGTEACASVTSAFLQVLATIHRVESCRTDRPRNILHILSTNTRRTKVVELSSGTHRVADDLRRHSLADGEGGHYSTNLDRNRYGSDNNYLFTVTKFNLDCLGLCPCLVDIEIVDTRNGNESQLVQAGAGACSCSSPARKERADASHFAGSAGPRPAAPSPIGADMRRVSSTGHLSSGPGMRRVSSAQAMRRPPSSGRLHDPSQNAAGAEGGGRQGGGEKGGGGTHSRNSGSELFDALLMAATAEDRHPAPSRGDPPVTSLHYPNAALIRQRSRPWALSEVDSLQDAINAFKGAEEEVGTGGMSRMRSRRMLRRNSVSMIIENPVLAQTGAAESLLLNHYPPFQALPPLRSPVGGGGGAAGPSRSARSGGGGGDAAEPSVRSHEGDTDSKGKEEQEVTGADDHDAFREGLLRHYHKQSSAVNLSRMAHPAELRRMQDEMRQLRDENRTLESELEEAKMREREARDAGEAKGQELIQTQTLLRRAADVVQRLKQVLSKQLPGAGGSPTNGAAAYLAASEATDGADKAAASMAVALDLAELVDAELEGVHTSEEQIEALRGELKAARKALARAESKQSEAEARLSALTAVCGGPAVVAAALRHHAAAVAAAAAAGGAGGLGLMSPPGYGMYAGLASSPYGLPPMHPYAMHPHYPAAFQAPHGSGHLQKVASMPLLGPGLLSPHHLPIAPLGAGAEGWGSGGISTGGRKRRGGSSPIPEDEPEEAPKMRRSEKGVAGASGSKRSPLQPPPFRGEGSGESEGGGVAEQGEGVSAGDSKRGQLSREDEVLDGAADGATDDDISSRGGGKAGGAQQAQQQLRQGRKDLSPAGAEGETTVHCAPPSGISTPKDAPLLPADPPTGASAAPLGLPPRSNPLEGVEVGGVDSVAGGLQEAEGKQQGSAEAGTGFTGEGGLEEQAQLLAAFVR